MSVFSLQDLDVFHISFDEPNAETNWKQILKLCPSAKRIHGILGFDKAHKVCALSSTTDRLVIIDGDNWLNDDTLTYRLDDTGLSDVCFSFKSKNIINDLEYGNGGIKIWSKDSLLSSNTHEKSNTTDFCWDIRYYQVDHWATTTVNNCTPYQAWRAGYREGVKLSYIDGKPMHDPMIDYEFIAPSNRSKLNIWMSVGRDVKNGIWAMLGTRQGFYDLYTSNISNTDINNYDWFADKWYNIKSVDPDITARGLGLHLMKNFKLEIPELDEKQSRWVKHIYINPIRSGFMR
jgi:hypothetical protein